MYNPLYPLQEDDNQEKSKEEEAITLIKESELVVPKEKNVLASQVIDISSPLQQDKLR